MKLVLTGNNQIMKFVKKSLLDNEIVGDNAHIENKISQIVSDGDSSTLALKGSTEEEQF